MAWLEDDLVPISRSLLLLTLVLSLAIPVLAKPFLRVDLRNMKRTPPPRGRPRQVLADDRST